MRDDLDFYWSIQIRWILILKRIQGNWWTTNNGFYPRRKATSIPSNLKEAAKRWEVSPNIKQVAMKLQQKGCWHLKKIEGCRDPDKNDRASHAFWKRTEPKEEILEKKWLREWFKDIAKQGICLKQYCHSGRIENSLSMMKRFLNSQW